MKFGWHNDFARATAQQHSAAIVENGTDGNGSSTLVNYSADAFDTTCLPVELAVWKHKFQFGHILYRFGKALVFGNVFHHPVFAHRKIYAHPLVVGNYGQAVLRCRTDKVALAIWNPAHNAIRRTTDFGIAQVVACRC